MLFSKGFFLSGKDGIEEDTRWTPGDQEFVTNDWKYLF